MKDYFTSWFFKQVNIIKITIVNLNLSVFSNKRNKMIIFKLLYKIQMEILKR